MLSVKNHDQTSEIQTMEGDLGMHHFDSQINCNTLLLCSIGALSELFLIRLLVLIHKMRMVSTSQTVGNEIKISWLPVATKAFVRLYVMINVKRAF